MRVACTSSSNAEVEMKSIALLPVILAACGSPELTRRYKSACFPPAHPAMPLVGVSAFVLDTPASSATKLAFLEMDERAQSAFVEALSSKAKTAADLRRELGGKLGTTKSPTTIDRTEFKKRIVVSADKLHTYEHVRPADRINALRTTFTVGLDKAYFKSWDRFETKYETVDLGKLSLTQGRTLKGTLAVGPKAGSSLPVSGTGEATGTRTLTEEVSLRQRYVSLTGALTPKAAVIAQEGVVGIDLTGNATVDVILRLSPDYIMETEVLVFSGLRTETGAFEDDEDKVSVSTRLLRFAESSDPITCDLTATYSLRRVRKGADTIVEGDDRVDYAVGPALTDGSFRILSEQDLKALIWTLRADPTSSSPDAELALAGYGTLQFQSAEEAIEFLRWLKATDPLKIRNARFELDGASVTDGADYDALSVHVIRAN